MAKNKEKSTNSQFAIHIAEGFYQTAIDLAKHSHIDNSDYGYVWIPPGVVNFSFATELLLKATIYYDLRKKGWGHKLYDLYLTLSVSTKIQIEEAYRKYRKDNENIDELPAYKIIIHPANGQEHYIKSENFDEIRNLLEIHSESFENWRYIHEFGEEGYCYEFDFKAMDAFYKALKDTLSNFLSKEKPTYRMGKV